jgi:PiT family inorganic phosphate transporter
MPHFWEEVNFGALDFLALPATVLLLLGLALAFDFLNGVHDSANSIATVVSTRVLRPYTAVVWAAFFNFIAFLVFHLGVAATIGKDIVDPDAVNNRVITATLLAACAWNIFTWYLGLPTSSSHALTFSLVGAGVAAAGVSCLQWRGLGKTLAFIVLSPVVGWAVAVCIAVAVMWLFRRAAPRRVDQVFRRGQLVSAALYSLGHGGNDAQKTMGIIFLLLLTASAATPSIPWQGRFELTDKGLAKLRTEPAALPGHVQARLEELKDRPFDSRQAFTQALHGLLPSEAVDRYEGKIVAAADNPRVPTEVVLACHLAMGLGTLLGGWRIVKTMGQRVVKLRPVDGFCAETGAAATLAMTVIGGIPVSTTHTITGALVGVGSLKRMSAVRWGVAREIVWAWVLTIPGTALMAAVFFLLLLWLT